MRHFHSYGPVEAGKHFAVPRKELIDRCVGQLVGDVDEGGHYFTIWAPRQTGKTWLMRQALQEVRRRYGERFLVGSLSMQGVIMRPDEPPEAFLKRVPVLLRNGFKLQVPAPPDWESFKDLFSRDQQRFAKPVILLIDEFDRLPPAVIDALVGLFRDLYLDRENHLLHSLALVGVRAVLGVESQRGSPFNVQRSLHVPNLSAEEVTELFRQYQEESGQEVAPEVVAKLYQVTRGQPGLVGWLGELLTEKYNRSVKEPITVQEWGEVYDNACTVEPNNTVLNLLKKAKDERFSSHIVALFKTSNIPFSFDDDWCNYLYLHGIVDYEEHQGKDGRRQKVCRFSSPLVQLRLYNAFSRDMAELGGKVLVVDPRVDLTAVFAALDLVALLGAYRDYLRRLKGQGINPWQGHPRRSDLHLREAVGHFHLYWWLMEATGRRFLITPEFPTGNGKVDLHLKAGAQAGVIEVKSFTQRSDLPQQKEQAARYASSQGLRAATLALFVPTDEEELTAELSAEDTVSVNGQLVQVSTVAIAAA